MVARASGLPVAVSCARRLLAPDVKGVSVAGLLGAAAEVGLSASAYRVRSLPCGLKLRLPLILHLSRGHFVVLVQLTKSGLVVIDPGVGVMTIPPDVYRRLSGIVVSFGRLDIPPKRTFSLSTWIDDMMTPFFLWFWGLRVVVRPSHRDTN